MKTKLLLLLLLANFSIYAQTNLVSNGGFESWTNNTTPTNWTVENNVKQNTQNYFRGFNSVQLSTFSTPLPKITSQVPMKAGITYTIKFKYKFISPSFESSRFPRVSLNITNNGSTKEYSNSKEIADTEWRTFEGSFTPDQDLSYDFSISLSGYQNYEFIAAIDEVMVYVQGTEKYTYIPDRYFELRLRDRGVDVGDIDGLVLTYWINTLTSLNLEPDLALYITDLTGIQDFTALASLDCSRNKLTTLDLSKNTALTKLDCSYNNLTTLDLSAQTKITSLECNGNKITSLDLSKQTGLNYVSCFNNSLTYLNIKNGNNTAIYWNGTDPGGFVGNPNLTCILVDDVIYWNKKWMNKKSSVATYSLTCDGKYTAIPDLNFEKKLINLYIDSGQPDGKVLTSSISSLNILDVSANSIANLKGIEDFISLTNLNCSQNNLTTLDLSNNTILAFLQCYSNKLTNLNISNTSLITTLDCSTNLLTSLNVSDNTILKDLVCQKNSLTSLNLANNTQLESLTCSSNKLIALDVSKNTKLSSLVSDNNQLKALDVSKNTLLTYLSFFGNFLTAIDVSKNKELSTFYCYSNLLTSLNISNNTKMIRLQTDLNKLTSLNLKNGNNTIIDREYTNFNNNQDLTCIIVDDVNYSNANWSNLKDATAKYNATCSNLGLEDLVFGKATLYPNPTKGEVNINNITLEKATVYNSLGQLVRTFTLDTSNTNNTINLSGLPKGIYYVYLINQDAASAKKVIVE
jgi:Leucine-rich repeat (LRR) protein